MNPDKENNYAGIEKSPLMQDKRVPLSTLYNPNTCVGPSPLGFKSTHLGFGHGCSGRESPSTPKHSRSSTSLPVVHKRLVTPMAQCYSDKSHVSNYSSTPVKRSQNMQKKCYSYLTPVSSKTCYPRVLNGKENTPRFSNSQRVYNPFDCYPEQLNYSSVSPSMFKEVVSPSEKVESNFSWAIDHIAVLHPAYIETSPYCQAELSTDPLFEAKAQEAIDKFFSKAVLPSPWSNSPARPLNLLSLMATNDDSNMSIGSSPALLVMDEGKTFGRRDAPVEKPKTCNAWTQTEISFPPFLPKDVEDAIAPFCTITRELARQEEDVEHSSFNATSLRRKLQFSEEDLLSVALRPNFTDSDSERHSSTRSISPIPLEDFDDVHLPWDTSMVSRPMFQQCDLCKESKSSTCMHVNAAKLRSSSTDLRMMSPNLSLISCGSPNGKAVGVALQSPGVSPIEKWSKKARKRSFSDEILSGTAAVNSEDGEVVQAARSGRNLRSMLSDPSFPPQPDFEFSTSLQNLATSDYNTIGDNSITPTNISAVMRLSPTSDQSNDRTFVTFINDEAQEGKYPYIMDDNGVQNCSAICNKKNEPNHIDMTSVNDGTLETKLNNDLAAMSNESRSMFMDVDSQRFENIFCTENSHSQDTGYQTGSFQPSYCSSNEQKNESVEKELIKAKVNEKFPAIFSSFNFHNES